MKELGKFEAMGEILTVARAEYGNERLAIQLIARDGSPWATLSVNLPEAAAPPEGYFYAKTWSENAPLRAAALSSGLFEDTGIRMQTGWTYAELWRLV